MNAPSFLQCKCQALLKCVEPYVFPSFFFNSLFRTFFITIIKSTLKYSTLLVYIYNNLIIKLLQLYKNYFKIVIDAVLFYRTSVHVTGLILIPLKMLVHIMYDT